MCRFCDGSFGELFGRFEVCGWFGRGFFLWTVVFVDFYFSLGLYEVVSVSGFGRNYLLGVFIFEVRGLGFLRYYFRCFL